MGWAPAALDLDGEIVDDLVDARLVYFCASAPEPDVLLVWFEECGDLADVGR